MLLLVMKPIKQQISESKNPPQETIPIWQLMMDPYIAVCAGALTMSNVALAFLEPTISLWMEDNMTTENWKIGMIWLPAFFPHVLGVIITVKMARRYPQHQWRMAAFGLALEGLSCFIIPFTTSYKMLMIPICVICFGIALIDTALLPMLGYLVDTRYISVYGSIYAIADISYSLAYAVGPIIAGGIVEMIGFTALNFIIAFTNLAYVPVLRYLANVYEFKPFEEQEANILMGDPPTKEYQTYALHNQQPVGDYKNHLEYGRIDDGGAMQETNIDQQYNYSQQQAQPDYEYQQQGGYQQSGYQDQGRSLPQPTAANPFRQAAQQQQEQPQAAPRAANPFRSGFN
jgi:MFS transporter, DHA1 family, solute carrier family 18 (vesicular acetylcholine transporter), member 3